MGTSQETLAKIVYIIYIASILLGGISLVGVVIAYAVRTSDAEDFVNSHFNNQIRVFWIFFSVMFVTLILFFLLLIASGLEEIALVGAIVFVILLAVGMNIWYVIRAALGLKALSRNERLVV